MQVQVEYEWRDIRIACIVIKKGFFKNRKYVREDIIDVAKSYHQQRLNGWEGWVATGHGSPFSGKA